MMVECNIKFQLCIIAYKSTHTSIHNTRLCGVAQGLQDTCLVLSKVSVGWSEPVNVSTTA